MHIICHVLDVAIPVAQLKPENLVPKAVANEKAEAEEEEVTRRAKQEASSKAEAAKAKGNACFEDKQYDEAIRLYSEAIALDDAKHEFYSNRSNCMRCRRTGILRRQSIPPCPSWRPPAVDRCVRAGYSLLKRYDEALEDAKRCIELNPSWVRVRPSRPHPTFACPPHPPLPPPTPPRTHRHTHSNPSHPTPQLVP